MRKLSLLALLLLLVAGSAHAQSSSVSIQVTDSGGVAWANGTVTFSYVGAPNPTWSGGNLPLSITATLNSSGAATQSVPDTNTITPGPASWALRICPQVGISAQCINQSPVAITGATPTLTLTPPAIQIQASTNFPISAYADAELVNVSLGFTFFNTVNGGTPGLRVCTAVSGTNCTSWSTVGPSSGGGVCPAGPTNSVQTNGGANCSGTANFIYDGANITGTATSGGEVTFIAGPTGANGIQVSPSTVLVSAFEAGGAINFTADASIAFTTNGAPGDIIAFESPTIQEVAATIATRSSPSITDTVGSASPVTPGSVTQRVVTAGPDTILSTDRNNRVAYNSTSSVAVSLPTAGFTGFAGGFNVHLSNQNTGTVTITPATGTINGNATLVMLEGQFCFVTPSAAGTSYAADCGESQMTAGTGILFTRGVHTLGVALSQTVAQTMTFSGNGALSTASVLMNGTMLTSTGSATTTFPFLYLDPSGAAAVTTFNTAGTGFALNTPNGFTGDDLAFFANGTRVLTINSGGAITSNSNISAGSAAVLNWTSRSKMVSTADGIIAAENNAGTAFTRFCYGGVTSSFPCLQVNGTSLQAELGDGSAQTGFSAKTYSTETNCANGASPAVCGSAASGAVAIPAGLNQTLVVNTSAVTANSRILLTIDESLTISGVTCNTTLSTLTQPVVTARTAGTSFTLQLSGTTTTNPPCVSYSVIDQ